MKMKEIDRPTPFFLGRFSSPYVANPTFPELEGYLFFPIVFTSWPPSLLPDEVTSFSFY